MDPPTSDADDGKVLLLAKNFENLGKREKPEKPEKSEKPKKPKTRKAVTCCFNTTKYTYRTCRCLIVYRCTWLFLILLVFLAVLILQHKEDIMMFFEIAKIIDERNKKKNN